MVIGFDVYRDKAKRKRSVGGFVASLNSTFSSWYSQCKVHRQNEEISGHLLINLTSE